MKMHDVMVLVDEKFTLSSGAMAITPGQSGVASEDINCRCRLSRDFITKAEYAKLTGKKVDTEESKQQEDILESDTTKSVGKKVKSAILQKDVIGFDEIPKEYKSEILKGLENSNFLAKNIFNYAFKETDYIISDTRKPLYERLANLVIVNPKHPVDTFAHEVMHGVDLKYKLSADGKVLKALYEDLDNINFGGDIKQWFIRNYPDIITRSQKNDIIVKKKYRGISDIISAYTDGGVTLGYGHKKEYWKRKNHKANETIAQYGRMYYINDNEVMGILQELLPKTTSTINAKFRGVLKNVGR